MRRFTVMAALGVGVCLWAVGAAGQQGAQESEYVGAAQCGQCHTAQAEQWQQTAHARAMDSLTADEQRNPRCRQCHTTAPDEDEPALRGVQCESCHGRGRYYSTKLAMRDPELRELLFFEKVGADTCKRCHTETAPSLLPFDVTVKMDLVKHKASAQAPQNP